MINPNKIIISELPISYYMDLKYPCNLWKHLELLLTFQKEDKR
jgi:predicted metalloenzyme YecM